MRANQGLMKMARLRYHIFRSRYTGNKCKWHTRAPRKRGISHHIKYADTSMSA